jgi:hypothetical protein
MALKEKGVCNNNLIPESQGWQSVTSRMAKDNLDTAKNPPHRSMISGLGLETAIAVVDQPPRRVVP